LKFGKVESLSPESLLILVSFYTFMYLSRVIFGGSLSRKTDAVLPFLVSSGLDIQNEAPFLVP